MPSRGRTSKNGRRGNRSSEYTKKHAGKRDDEPDEMTRVHKKLGTARDGFQKHKEILLSFAWLGSRHSSWPVQCNTTHLPLPAVVRRCCSSLARRCVPARGTWRLNLFVLRLLDQRRKPRLAHLDGRTGMTDPVLIFPGRNQNIHLKSPVMKTVQNVLCFTVMRHPPLSTCSAARMVPCSRGDHISGMQRLVAASKKAEKIASW